MTDRDHFAAAALTGFASQLRYGSVFNLTLTAKQCYELADAMLRERERTNHDAAPAAIANAESVAPQPTAGDRAGSPPSHSGTGDTPDSPKPIKGGVSDSSKPINGPTPVHTPPAHTTPGEGSVPREGTEPVAWGVVYPNDEVAVIAFKRKDAEERATASDRIVPLYRHSPCQDSSQKNLTLTDCERGAIERAVDSIASTMPYESQQGLADWKTLRGLLERLRGVE